MIAGNAQYAKNQSTDDTNLFLLWFVCYRNLSEYSFV